MSRRLSSKNRKPKLQEIGALDHHRSTQQNRDQTPVFSMRIQLLTAKAKEHAEFPSLEVPAPSCCGGRAPRKDSRLRRQVLPKVCSILSCRRPVPYTGIEDRISQRKGS